MPVAAVTVDALLNGRTPSTADIAGTALVAAGVAFGAMPQRARARRCLPRSRRRAVRLATRCEEPTTLVQETLVAAPMTAARAARDASGGHRKGREVFLNVGIGLALFCAAVTQLGFLCKHRGARRLRRSSCTKPLRRARALFRSRWFAIGMASAPPPGSCTSPRWRWPR